MTAICFKLPEREASFLRRQAHEAHMTVSAFLRQLINKKAKKKEPLITIKYSKLTGAPAFYSKDLPPLTTEKVKEMLVDFP
ncbi:MAG: hypothetical protein A3F67_07520 [Verrucomicrobia bacterium RIFCSPHIGHO2_12_FULL_41_10]|nr:MAG: hypothetical protein A3F67_07520 [Verrucomicrobia bacterium RIFCSPHIGHO2_12_FULL_41_10]HLB32794.1 hypothetical protein [Chthoniobacterales bacterium]